MKNLNEEINDIKNGKGSKVAKKTALVKLGLQPYEVNLILADLPKSERTGIRVAPFTFGVEIECYVYSGAIRTAAETTGLNYQYQGYNHTNGHSFFKFVPDSSLSLGGANGIECVSPVLKGVDGKKMLKNACDTLNQANATIKRTCGLHVHIGASDLTQLQYANVFANYYHMQSLISTFMAPSRRYNGYASPLTDRHAVANAMTREDVLRAMNYDRYYAVNATSFDRHGTIEFRQHGGTTDYEKIINWVAFCGKLVEWSKKNRLTEKVNSIDDIKFLTKKEKDFFKKRAIEFASR